MAHPISILAADTARSPYLDSLLVFLGPPALGFDREWSAFQDAARLSVTSARTHRWWTAEEKLFAEITRATNGKASALDRILSLGLGRPARADARLHLTFHRAQWVPAVGIPLDGVRDRGVAVPPRQVLAAADRIAAGFGTALARAWVDWLAPVPPTNATLRPARVSGTGPRSLAHPGWRGSPAAPRAPAPGLRRPTAGGDGG